MFEKEVEITIKFPLRFEYEPPEYEDGYQSQPANICDLDWSDGEVQKALILEIYMPELHDELIEHAKEQIQAEKDEAKIAKWEAQNER
jgi:hypothetical protein